MTTAPPVVNLLPHLNGWWDGPNAPSPWVFGPGGARAAELEKLPPRVWQTVLCEYAVSVLPVWLAYSTADDRPQRSINDRLACCRSTTCAAYAAGAAYAAYATYAAYAAGAAYAAYAAGAGRAAQWRWMYAVYQSAQPIAWSPDWNTSTVIALAEVVWTGDYSALPILADALQDAGCDNDDMLVRLRSAVGPHTRADVAVWTPLGLGGDK